MTKNPIEMNRSTTHAKKQAVKFIRNQSDPYSRAGSALTENTLCWKWGEDNLFPYVLSLLSRRSTVHRRILNDKASYIAGKGISYHTENPRLAQMVETANGSGETLRQIVRKVAFDKMLFGNAFLEIVTDEKRSFLSLFHQDASKCRLAKDKQHILLYHNWQEANPKNTKKLPLYPVFEKGKDGTMRSVIHYKEYEPMFENYGIPTYIAGMNVSAIAYKTDRWNISRLDNSFQLSGVMMLDADVDSDSEAEYILRQAEEKFAGKPGQVMFLVKGMNENESSKFIPITSNNEGDWKDLHSQATNDIVVAHSWFRSLSGLEYSTGFSSERILHEYEIALNTLILGEQEEILEPIRAVIENQLQVDASSIQVVNRPPREPRPEYMRVWEARKADGLPFDENDPAQQLFLSQI
ncbi:phage portal protein [Alistipes sp. OttesenSCG-928-L06]|nr:phage portal protein [Alistipes sp. OttesenSCG-928-L06]